MDYASTSNHSANPRIDLNTLLGKAKNFATVFEKVATNERSKDKSDIMTNTAKVSFTTIKMSLDNALNNPGPMTASKQVFENKIIPPNSKTKLTKTNLGQTGKDAVRNETANTKPARIRNKMYYCEYCDTCTAQKCRTGVKGSKNEIHYTGECIWTSSAFCPICGLKFTSEIYQSHKASHKKYKLAIELHKFYRWQDEKPLTKAPIPRYPYCQKCKVYYLPRMEKGHNHSETKSKCKICKKVYDGFTYELHKNFHKACMSSKDDINLENKPVIDTSENISIGAQGETVIEFFRCKICAATYHVKGYVARHKCDTPLRHCKQCNMLIPAPHYKKHSELHDRYNNTNCRGTITEFENDKQSFNE